MSKAVPQNAVTLTTERILDTIELPDQATDKETIEMEKKLQELQEDEQ